MNFFDASILGVVEGITEFLPISSTGHLVLVSDLLGISDIAFTKSFEIAIQLGAILSVVVLYWKHFLNVDMLKRLAVAFVPTGIIGLLFYKMVKLLLGSPLVVVASLFVGGGVLILFEYWYKGREPKIHNLSALSYTTAVSLGFFQAISIIPGVSRSGATILGGLFLGMKREVIVEFSFLLAVPTMLVATGYDLWKNATAFQGTEWHLVAVGFFVSFLVALGAIRFFLQFVRTRTFIVFGVYRMLLAAVFFFFILS